MFFMGSASGALATTISIVSIMNRIQLNLTADTAQIDDIDTFMNIFNKQVEKFGVQFADGEED